MSILLLKQRLSVSHFTIDISLILEVTAMKELFNRLLELDILRSSINFHQLFTIKREGTTDMAQVMPLIMELTAHCCMVKKRAVQTSQQSQPKQLRQMQLHKLKQPNRIAQRTHIPTSSPKYAYLSFDLFIAKYISN